MVDKKLIKKPIKLPTKNPSAQYHTLIDTRGIVASSKIITARTAYVEIVDFPNITSTVELNIITTKKIQPIE
jgi:hypothetical protein